MTLIHPQQAAAWPLAAVTAWRATFVKAEVDKGGSASSGRKAY